MSKQCQHTYVNWYSFPSWFIYGINVSISGSLDLIIYSLLGIPVLLSMELVIVNIIFTAGSLLSLFLAKLLLIFNNKTNKVVTWIKKLLAVVTTEATKQKKKFFVVKKRDINKQWLPITLYDDEGHYRGVAYFDDFFTAFKYMQKFEQKLIKNYLREVNDNNGGN